MQVDASLELIQSNDKQEWDGFVSSSKQGSVFCKTNFLDSLDVDYEIWLVKNKSDIKLGAVILKDHAGQPLQAPYAFSSYHGLLFDSKITNLTTHSRSNESLKLLDFMLSGLESRYDLISFCTHPQFEDLRSLSWFNYHQPELGQFQISLYYTGIIDLSNIDSFENYLGTISKSKRYEYRKAEKQKVTIESSSDVNILERLYLLTFERQNMSVEQSTVQLMCNIVQAALDGDYGELFICRDINEEVISATFFLYDESKAYYLIGANHPDYRKTGASIYLLLENIRHYYTKGIKQIDVCGINSPSRGGFKTSLNATPTPYFTATWDSTSSID